MDFDLPIGAPSDVKELEYVVALHQSCAPDCRRNATISSIDVGHFLKSRFGFDVPHERLVQMIRSFRGGVIGPDVMNKLYGEGEEEEDDGKEDEIQANANRRRVAAALRMLESGGQHFTRLVTKPKAIFKTIKSNTKLETAQEDTIEVSDAPKDEKEQGGEDGTNQDAVAEKLDEKEEVNQDNEGDEQEFIDLVQLTAALLIPSIARAAAPSKDELGENDNQEESMEPPATMLVDALRILLESVNDRNKNGPYPRLDAELVRNILAEHGEYERAADDVLVSAMVDACASSSGLFDEQAWKNALINDIVDRDDPTGSSGGKWEVGCEDHKTSTMYDVWGFSHLNEQDEIRRMSLRAKNKIQRSSSLRKNEDEGNNNLELTYGTTANIVDLVLDSHNSLILVVAIWVFFFANSIVYATLFDYAGVVGIDCEVSFSCTLSNTIQSWLSFAIILTICGFIIVLPLSVGNDPRRRTPFRAIFAIVVGIILVVVPFVTVEDMEARAEEPFEGIETLYNSRWWDGSQQVVQITGYLVIALQIKELILSFAGDEKTRANRLLRRYFTTSNVQGTSYTKKAATRKLNRLLSNALLMHPATMGGDGNNELLEYCQSSRLRSEKQISLLNFHAESESQKTVPVGGFFWIWNRLKSRELFNVDGVWIPTRMYIVQATQAALIVLSAILTRGIISDAAIRADEEQEKIASLSDVPEWLKKVVPSGFDLRVSLYTGMGMGWGIMIVLWAILVPSAVSTVLQFRAGIIPSLRSEYFSRYRNNVELIYVNMANPIYGMIGAGVLFFLLTSVSVFLFVWDLTRDIMLIVLAWGIGLTVTILLKVLVIMLFKRNFYTGLYRIRPAMANLSTLALECWYIGTGAGVLLGRFTQFLLAACFWVGRAEVPFLSRNVTLLGYDFDYVPIHFVKELLMHEAHRHPYIDRLGTMYMMELKNDGFCQEAHSCWRQLFVVALMPWLTKYRILEAEYHQMREEKKEMQAQMKKQSILLSLRGVASIKKEEEPQKAGGV